MALIYSPRDLSKIQERKIFVDANVLIYIFWSSKGTRSKIYTSVLQDIIKQKNTMYIDFNIVSEVVNRVFKTEYDNHMKENGYLRLKEYRTMQEGKDTLSNIYMIFKKQILTQIEIIGKSFSRADIENFLVVESLDFNDKAIVSICKENNLVLLTNDYDFKGTDIDILTSNPAILSN